MQSVSVVIPCRNEEKSIVDVLQSLPDFVTEVIVVDGESTDRTVDVVRETRPDARIMGQHSPGKGAATIAGASVATGQIIVLLDGDDSMEPGRIQGMIDQLVQGADIVHASREIEGGGSADFTTLRRLGNRVLKVVVNTLYGVAWTDPTYGYVAMWRDVVTKLRLPDLIDNPAQAVRDAETGHHRRPTSYGHGFEVEVLLLCRGARAGLVIKETPAFENKRRHGTSNLHAAKDGLRVLIAIVKERFGDFGVKVEPARIEQRQFLRLAPPAD